jgi:hypothetical protein
VVLLFRSYAFQWIRGRANALRWKRRTKTLLSFKTHRENAHTVTAITLIGNLIDDLVLIAFAARKSHKRKEGSRGVPRAFEVGNVMQKLGHPRSNTNHGQSMSLAKDQNTSEVLP